MTSKEKERGASGVESSVSVVIPAFNEEESIGPIIGEIRNILGGGVEIVVVDDGSRDATAAVARERGATVYQHPYNMGNGAAVKTGLRRVRSDVVVLMDGDGQHDPKDIPRLLEHTGQYDMVVGSRTSGSASSWHRGLANRVYNGLASYVTQFPVGDLTSGFRAIRRETARSFLYLLPNRFSYPTTITLAVLKSGLRVKYVPIRSRARVGKSKIRIVTDGPRFLLIIVKIATLFSPFRIFLPVSLLFFTLGIGYYTYTFVTQHRFTNMSMLLFVTSVIIFMLGLVAEQVAELRMDRSEVDWDTQ